MSTILASIGRARRSAALLLSAAAAGLILAGCQAVGPTSKAPAGANAAGAPPVVEWEASDYTYNAPETLPAGLVTIRMTNRGHEPHHGQLLRLNDGVTFDQFAAALQQEGDGALRLASAEGGPAAIDPHRADEVTLDLKPGTYALTCFIPSSDGVPHLAKGMLKPLEVAASGAAAATPPEVRGTFTMRDFSFLDLPDSLPAGKATYKVENVGPQPHELVILKLAPGKAAEDVQAWYKAPAGPPPFEAVGGINGLSMGRAGYMTLDLQPGTYVAVCEIPDPASRLAHQHLGMIKAFTVR